jgi:acyl-CoA synthetase (AMP-forming)/AMP-acid ligase II
MRYSNVVDIVHAFAEQATRAEAMVLGDARYSYSDLAISVHKLAKALLASGVRKGDRVATLCPPHPNYLATFLAAASIGAIWVGLNPKYRQRELLEVVTDAQPRILFASAQGGGRDLADDIAALEAAIAGMIVVSMGECLVTDDEAAKTFLGPGADITDEAVAAATRAAGGRDACAIVYTSGSTGIPKGALLHHDGLIRFALGQNRHWPLSRLRVLNYFPINHVGCLADITMPALVAGGTVVFMPEFDTSAAMRLLGQESITLWGSVPSVFAMQLALPDYEAFDLSTVELIVWEGGPMPRPLLERLADTGIPMATNYGMTETTSAVTIAEPTRDIAELADTVGRPFDDVELRIGTPDENGIGEIETRSPLTMLGYWNQPHATGKVLSADGWLKTGDLGTILPDGRLRLAGRSKDMFKSGGYNVYPAEVEAVLGRHPNVHGVAVVGAPDRLWQESGVAFMVADVPEDELKTYLAEHLANYKRPKRFVFLDALPLLPIGKVDKSALRQRVAALVGGNG